MALLLWSGGCDSTLLLHDLLTAKKNHDKLIGRYVTLNEGEYIRTISINDSQVAGSAYARKARDILLPLLRKRYKNQFVHGEITIKRKGLFIDQQGHGLSQPGMWLLHACSYLDPKEDLYAGYIKGDDVWHYQGWLYQAFTGIQNITGRSGLLRLPLEWATKGEVIHYLRRAKLLKKTWYCECSENGKPCKKCPSCHTHKTGLWRLKKRIEVYTDDTPKVKYENGEWKADEEVSKKSDSDGDRRKNKS